MDVLESYLDNFVKYGKLFEYKCGDFGVKMGMFMTPYLYDDDLPNEVEECGPRCIICYQQTPKLLCSICKYCVKTCVPFSDGQCVSVMHLHTVCLAIVSHPSINYVHLYSERALSTLIKNCGKLWHRFNKITMLIFICAKNDISSCVYKLPQDVIVYILRLIY